MKYSFAVPILAILVSLWNFALSQAQLYQPHEVKVEKTPMNDFDWERDVMSSPLVYAIAFNDLQAEWCDDCKLVPNILEAAAQKVGQFGAGVAMVNGPSTPELLEQYDISDYPTILIFPAGNKRNAIPKRYEGRLTQEGLTDAIMLEVSTSSLQSPGPIDFALTGYLAGGVLLLFIVLFRKYIYAILFVKEQPITPLRKKNKKKRP
jgi:thiol-disulfide isomerase/thioredoxin